jgi:hypothetical protein
MAVPLQRKCTCLNEPVIGLEEFDKRFDSESENRMTSTMTSASFADKYVNVFLKNTSVWLKSREVLVFLARFPRSWEFSKIRDF